MRISRPTSRLQAVLCGIFSSVVAGGFLGAVLSMNGPVRIVTVSGELTAAERNEVRAAVVGALDGNLLSLDLDAVVEKVLALSWPHDVRVRRTFPDGVDLLVGKEVFVARWGSGGVLNSEGDVITTANADVSVLPVIDCALADGARAMQVYQTLVGALVGRDIEVSALRENEIGEWSLELGGRLTVALGGEDMPGRLERFLVVYDSVLTERLDEVRSVDARYANGIAVNWRTGDRPQSGPVQLAGVSGAMTMSH